MKAKAIAEHFAIHRSTVAIAQPTFQVLDTDKVATLFGMDEVKFDFHGKRIRLPDLGWVPVPSLRQDHESIDWLALTNDGEKAEVILGRGAPFLCVTGEIPVRNGVVLAVPYSITAEKMRQMP